MKYQIKANYLTELKKYQPVIVPPFKYNNENIIVTEGGEYSEYFNTREESNQAMLNILKKAGISENYIEIIN